MNSDLIQQLNLGHFILGVIGLAFFVVSAFWMASSFLGLLDALIDLASRRSSTSAAGRAQRAPQARSEARPAAPAALGGFPSALPDGNHGDNRTSIK